MSSTTRSLSIAFIAVLIHACMPPLKNPHPDVHGHRGCRGLMPENSLPAFLKAVDIGCDYLELDLVISGDGQLVVSHEPWMNEAICLTPDGNEMTFDEGRALNLYRMTVAEIQRYDCGSREQARFPDQEQRNTYKPTLREVVEAVDEHALMSGAVSPSYNIEIKSDPAWYGIMQPRPEPYAEAVLATIDSLGIASRCIVQSFDPAILEAVRAQRNDITLALLVENKDGLNKNLERLTFKPDIYSPHFELVDGPLLEKLREKEIDLVVWTVNEEKDIQRMLKLGVDGIISDYPDRVIAELEGQD